MTPAEIGKIKDPAERARQAQGFLTRGEDALLEVRAIRDSAIAEWREAGATQRQIATALGLSPGLIGQIDSRTTKVEKL